MASLVTCKVCKKEHSDDVKRCPSCGAKYSKPILKRPVLIVFLAFFAFIVFKCTSGMEEAGRSRDIHESTKTPEQRAAERKAADETATKQDAAIGCEIMVKKSMKDPSSFDIDSDATRGTLKNGKGAVTIFYRAKNSFAAIVPGATECKFVVTSGTSTQITATTQIRR